MVSCFHGFKRSLWSMLEVFKQDYFSKWLKAWWMKVWLSQSSQHRLLPSAPWIHYVLVAFSEIHHHAQIHSFFTSVHGGSFFFGFEGILNRSWSTPAHKWEVKEGRCGCLANTVRFTLSLYTSVSSFYNKKHDEILLKIYTWSFLMLP